MVVLAVEGAFTTEWISAEGNEHEVEVVGNGSEVSMEAFNGGEESSLWEVSEGRRPFPPSLTRYRFLRSTEGPPTTVLVRLR